MINNVVNKKNQVLYLWISTDNYVRDVQM